MKKRLISMIIAAAMAVMSLPAVTFAADSEIKPILQYTFDGKKPLADINGKNEMRILGGTEVIEDGNTGKALRLDGVDGFAQLPDNIMSDSMTIAAWVRLDKFTTWGRVFDFGTDSSENFFFAPYSGGTARAEIKTKTGVDTVDAAQETVRGDWVHYAVTVGNGAMSYYRNGRLISEKPITQKLSEMNNVANYIGKSHYDGDAYLAAAIDDFRVYDTVLDYEGICNVMEEGQINSEILLDSYSIEDNQIVTGDKIILPRVNTSYPMPSFYLDWESDNKDIIEIDKTTYGYRTAIIHHPQKTTAVKLTAEAYSGCVPALTRDYTVYVTGEDENPYTINIDASDRSKDVSDIMWGLFFEDINSSADGGLYAEMVENRSFEINDEKEGHLYNWGLYRKEKDNKISYTAENIQVKTENPLNKNNPTYVTIPKGEFICNDGFYDGTEWDCDKGTSFSKMEFKEGEKYNFSVYVRGEGELTVSLAEVLDLYQMDYEMCTNNDTQAVIKCDSKNEWKKYNLTFTADDWLEHCTSGIILENTGDTDLDIDMVSLIPQDTYKGHGLRKDLMEQLEAMHPKFLRFPGGCAVEGNNMSEAWNWKDTIGDVSERKEMPNIWGYHMTYGLGFYEYFQMCEDLGMEPVPILNCGIACQVRSGSAEDEAHLVPMDKLQPYIDDALDLIAFANGTDESNEWTKKRIEMGHPEPFNMKYIGIGNEQYGEIYWERYAEFAKQIHEKYPEINLVTTSGTASSGTGNDLAWNWANANDELADRMDEHYYENADWFRTHAYRYDNYRRDTNTKVFLGEYASKGNTWYNALCEAAFMTGLERNADVVRMASYAPMFAKYGNVQWTAANMIWFNNDDYVLTPNYYVQSLFSNNKGDYSLPTEVKMNAVEKDDTFKGGVLVGSWGTHNEFKDIKVVSGDTVGFLTPDSPNEMDTLESWGWEAGSGEWTMKDGSIIQTSDETGSTCYIGPMNYNYTLSLKAKKTAGGEGFQIGVAAEDGQNYYRVNIGGWGNTTAKVQRIVNGVSAETGNVAEQSYVGDVHINDNEWYDVRVEVSDYEIKAYLNDKFICSYVKPKEYGPVYASSVYDEQSGEVIVKLVNTMDSDVNIGVNVNNAKVDRMEATVMSGDTKLENTLENNYAIEPKNIDFQKVSNEFTYNAPANSFSVIKLSALDTHKSYISGYTDGTFRPDNTITRPETAVMFAKLGGIDESKTYEHNFQDVPKDAWYSNYAAFALQKGYMYGCSGYGSVNGHFMPESNTTRAEFASVICHYMGIIDRDNYESLSDKDSKYSDATKEHWALAYINAVSDNGLMKGYPDGTFKPDEYVTRAEAVTIINRALNRADTTTKNPFKDVSPSHWAYNEILKAVN